MKLLFLDIEASALDNGYPIEIGWAVLDLAASSPRDAIAADAFLIRPPHWWRQTMTWSPEAEQVHRIQLEELLTSGLPVDTAVTRLNDVLSERDMDDPLGGVLWTDSGATWDREWLSCLYAASIMDPPPIEVEDLDVLVGSFGKPFDQARYQAAVSWLDRLPTAHRAAPDARAKAEFVWRYINGQPWD